MAGTSKKKNGSAKPAPKAKAQTGSKKGKAKK